LHAFLAVYPPHRPYPAPRARLWRRRKSPGAIRPAGAKVLSRVRDVRKPAASQTTLNITCKPLVTMDCSLVLSYNFFADERGLVPSVFFVFTTRAIGGGRIRSVAACQKNRPPPTNRLAAPHRWPLVAGNVQGGQLGSDLAQRRAGGAVAALRCARIGSAVPPHFVRSRPHAAASAKGPVISCLMRCTVPVPTPSSRATLRMPFPARN
jgi:hypothetical protein